MVARPVPGNAAATIASINALCDAVDGLQPGLAAVQTTLAQVQAALGSETQTRAQADAAEGQARQGGDVAEGQARAQAVAAEAQARAQAVATLGAQLRATVEDVRASLQAAVAGEATTRGQADQVEAQTRAAADQGLTNALAAEAQTRTAADRDLVTRVANEASNRQGGDASVLAQATAAVQAEAGRRIAGDRAAPWTMPVRRYPGDAATFFTTSIEIGAPAVLPDLEAGGLVALVDDDAGRVARFYGEGVLAERVYTPLEAGRRYRARVAVRRRSDAADPDNDAVRFGVAWFDRSKAPLTDMPATSELRLFSNLTVGAGRLTASATIAGVAGSGIDLVAPAGARYFRLFVQVWGTSQRTDVEVLGWDDATDTGVIAPNIQAAEARIAALESFDAEVRLNTLEAEAVAPHAVRLPVLADLASARLSESTRTVEVQGYAEPGDKGGALYRRVAGEPAHPGKVRSADGAWWEYVVVQGVIPIEAFGGRADCTNGSDGTDNLPALLRASAVAPYNPMSPNFPFGARIQFGVGGYRMSDTIDAKRCLPVFGVGSGICDPAGAATAFYFPADRYGLVTNSFNTEGGGLGPATTSAFGTAAQGIRFVSAGGTDRTKCGMWMRVTSTIRDCLFENFPGDGIKIVATAGGPPDREGNANGFFIERCCVIGAGRHGLFIAGQDVNAGVTVGFQCRSAAGCGIYDISALGNTHIGPQIDEFNTNELGRCTLDGLTWLLISYLDKIGGQVEPGTDENTWISIGPMSDKPAWTPGRYFEPSMPIFVSGGSNRTTVIGPYTEGGISHCASPSMVMGGQAGWTRTSGALKSAGEGLLSNSGVGGSVRLPPNHPIGEFAYSTVGNGLSVGVLAEYSWGVDPSFRYRFQIGADGREMKFEAYEAAGLPAYTITSLNTRESFGRLDRDGNPVPQPMTLKVRQLAIGDGSATSPHRMTTVAAGPPPVLEHAQGDFVRNIAPTPGGTLGWLCVEGGTPGTWVPVAAVRKIQDFYAISNAQPSRALDPSTASAAQVGNTLAALIADLRGAGVIA